MYIALYDLPVLTYFNSTPTANNDVLIVDSPSPPPTADPSSTPSASARFSTSRSLANTLPNTPGSSVSCQLTSSVDDSLSLFSPPFDHYGANDIDYQRSHTETMTESSPSHSSFTQNQSTIQAEPFIANHSSTSSTGCSSQHALHASSKGLDELVSEFAGTHTQDQITAIYELSGSDYEGSSRCLSSGPELSSIMHMCTERFKIMPRFKLSIDSDDMWGDMMAAYKGHMDLQSQLRITLDNQPAIDTGGVRRQVYTTLYQDFAFNQTVKLFDGPINHLRPFVKSFGILKILGTMIAHSIFQDGIGFHPLLIGTWLEGKIKHWSLCQ